MSPAEYQVHQDPNPERLASKLNQGHLDGYEVIASVGNMVIMRLRTEIAPNTPVDLGASQLTEGGDYAQG